MPSDISREKLLTAERNISAEYPLSFTKVELTFRSDDDKCRLWFIEDQNGEFYKYDKCP
jgi:hypothetical protein